MLKKLKYFVLTGILLGVSCLGLVTTRIQAQGLDPKSQACEALGGAATGAATGAPTDCQTAPGTPDVNSTLKLGINVFSLIIGVSAVIMIIVGGMKYIISQGDSNNINSAKNTILYALIGLVVVALAQMMVRFVLKKTAAPASNTPPASVQADGSSA